MNNALKIIFGVICGFLACALIWLFATPRGKALFNKYDYTMHKVDESTKYSVLKEVEDTCRAMQASYEADKLTYEQYNGQEGEKQTWADQAKMRANRTAATYNEYVLKNSYVWSGNVPEDISMELAYIS